MKHTQDSNESEAANVEQMDAQDTGVEESGNGNGQVSGVAGGANADSEQTQPSDLAAQYLDALQRERASFINYRRRTEQERAEMAQYAAASLIKKLLPVVDDFDRALEAIPQKEREHNKWVAGIELIARKLHTILEQEGVQPIEAMGQPFDPNLHEAVAFEDNAEGSDSHEDTVSAVFSKGYKMHDRVLRPAMVKVSRG